MFNLFVFIIINLTLNHQKLTWRINKPINIQYCMYFCMYCVPVKLDVHSAHECVGVSVITQPL